MAIVRSLAYPLCGLYYAPTILSSRPQSTTLPGYQGTWYTDVAWSDVITDENASKSSANGTIIGNTRFNSKFDSFSRNSSFTLPTISFNITQELLNEALLNVTVSLIPTYRRWNTMANVTIDNMINSYDFSKPVNFFVPYGLNLLLSLPFLILGGFALRKNGVSAIPQSFVQYIMTTTGSANLEKAAAGGCLGGEGNVPPELKNLKIRFGELRRGNNGLVRRAGFGTDDEVLPLERSTVYGFML